MIELNELHIKNFFSHSDSILNFDDLNGLVLLSGINKDGRFDSNGSGKSSVLEGIVYSITGNTLRNVGVNDMVNRVTGKNTMSQLTLRNNSIPVTITRYRKDELHGDSLVLLEDGKDISSRLNKSTQETINRKLNIPYNVLVNTILLGEGLSSRFTQLSDPDKKSLIESTLSLSYDVNSLRDKVNSYIKSLKSDISRLEGSISSMKSMIESFNPSDSPDIDKAKLSDLLSRKSTVEDKLSSLSKDIELYSVKIKTLEDSKINYERLYTEYTNLTNKQNDIISKRNSVDIDNSVCMLCGQRLSSEEVRSRVKKNYQDQLTDLSTMLSDIVKRLESLPEYSVITEKLSELQSSKSNIDTEYRNLNSELLVLTRDIASVESTLNHKKTLLENIENYKIQVGNDTKEYSEKSVELSDYDYMYKLFSPTGLIVYILEDAISYINDRLSIYTSMLIDKSYKFELSKGKLGLVDSSGASYQSLSNGEKRRLDISIQFALHDYVYNYCGLQINFCFIDEVLDTLDSVGVDNIFEVLRLKMEYCNLKGVIVITHNQSLKDKFDKVITVVKDSDGFSKIL